MTMTERRRTRPPKQRPFTLALESAGQAVRLKLAGEAALALPEGALWLEARQALIVSDLHFEKGSVVCAQGPDAAALRYARHAGAAGGAGVRRSARARSFRSAISFMTARAPRVLMKRMHTRSAR